MLSQSRLITVFTPAFNRAHTLGRLYESLLRQTNKNFCWLIVDDGSTDETRELVSTWVGRGLEIKYIYQANKGMLAAHNTAYDNAETELVMCVDSDDYLLDNAISVVAEVWQDASKNKKIGGVVGLDILEGGSVLGDEFPVGVDLITFLEIRFKYKIKGDKKYVYRRDVVNEFGRFPEFVGEKFPAASYLYRKIDSKYFLKAINIPLCVVEYQADGNSRQKINQYKKSPNAFMSFRVFCMDFPFSFREKFVSAIHYVSACCFARKYSRIFFNRHFVLTSFVAPLGVGLFLYLKNTKRSGFMK